MLLTAFLFALTTQSHALTPAIAQSGTLSPQHIAAGDLDGDGRTDLYIANPDGGRLLVRDANGALSPALPDLVPSVPGRSASWSDVDEDGDLDLFVWGVDAGHLLLNESGVLRDATAESGLLHTGGIVTGIDWIDLDANGTADLILSASRGVLGFRNLGEAHFEAVDLGPLAPAVATSPVPNLPAAEAPVRGDALQTHPERTHADVGPWKTSLPASPPSTSVRRSRRSISSGPASPTVGSGPPQALQFGGFCAARIHDAITGGCLQASATPTLGMLMPLSAAFNIDAITGNAGFGTTAPETRIQIAGGSDVTPAGGGNIQFGVSSGQNIAIDENEIMARNNGTYSSLFINNEGGNVLISAIGSGKVGIGIAHPSGRLHVVDSTGGDGSVVLPTSSISANEIEAEPGVASDWAKGTNVGLNGLIVKTILSRSLTAPSGGYVVAIMNATVRATINFGTFTTQLTVDPSTSPTSFDVDLVQLSDERLARTWTRVFKVAKGLNTFYLLGTASNSSNPPRFSTETIVEDAGITLLFVPTAYGTVK